MANSMKKSEPSEASARAVISVVDDDELSRKSICALVHSLKMCCRPFASSDAFLAEFDAERPGCIVADHRLRGLSGLALIKELVARDAPNPVILVTAFATPRLVVAAMKMGAVTVLEKPYRDTELKAAICDALKFDATRRARRARKLQLESIFRELSLPEREVLRLLLTGATNQAIAEQQKVGLRTIETRRQRVFQKTGAGSLADLVRMSVELEKCRKERLALLKTSKSVDIDEAGSHHKRRARNPRHK